MAKKPTKAFGGSGPKGKAIALAAAKKGGLKIKPSDNDGDEGAFRKGGKVAACRKGGKVC